MPLDIVTFELGEMANNTYLVGDPDSGQAVVIDPSFESEVVLEEAARRGWQMTAVWLTHAHFDHIAGVRRLVDAFQPPLPVGLHPGDFPLLRQSGGSRLFGIQVDPVPPPSIHFDHGQTLLIGQEAVEVRHTPGHTPGHVVIYSASSGVVFCGDLIFYHGVGRTDLPGGDYQTLLHSLHTQIFTLPPETRLLSGHGPETTVREEYLQS
jgi:glyoxylase-like metal-dependent hydrolase (beta-lactamase superfamily II)